MTIDKDDANETLEDEEQDERFHGKRSQKIQHRSTVMQELQGEIIQLLNRYELPVSSKFSVLVATAIMEALKNRTRDQVAQMLRQSASAEENRDPARRRH